MKLSRGSERHVPIIEEFCSSASLASTGASIRLGPGRVTCGYTSRVSNYYKRASRRVQCGGGRGATTERLPCNPEDLDTKKDDKRFFYFLVKGVTDLKKCKK
ncbi:hypothetical protein TSAR_014203 [Trichomalopsis sarcophagae]|uniref:Uncharacterized protein n=1 Tax=Trichomalopsis sarcophagae TaxID=543379 RepID=A0A232FJV8_9HYME|nr:hypothetical protein TSAR_014203 [Trichomalopsis sarcophagae]